MSNFLELVTLLPALVYIKEKIMGYINEQYYILSLAKAIVLQDEIPIDKSVNWKVIYNLCKYHKIDNLIAYGIDYLKQEIDIPKQIIEAFDCARKQ